MSKYIPAFPYKGSQILISSDRVVLHSEDDSIFLFGKKAIGLSSVGRVNVDTKEGTTINAPEIELGIQAKTLGEPVAKADAVVEKLQRVLNTLSEVAKALQNITLEGSAPAIIATSTVLAETCDSVASTLSEIKSTITYTR